MIANFPGQEQRTNGNSSGNLGRQEPPRPFRACVQCTCPVSWPRRYQPPGVHGAFPVPFAPHRTARWQPTALPCRSHAAERQARYRCPARFGLAARFHGTTGCLNPNPANNREVSGLQGPGLLSMLEGFKENAWRVFFLDLTCNTPHSWA